MSPSSSGEYILVATLPNCLLTGSAQETKMKLLLLLVLVVSVASEFLEPNSAEWYRCSTCGDPVTKTGDGVFLYVEGLNKKLTLWRSDNVKDKNQGEAWCFFHVMCLFRDQYYHPDMPAPQKDRVFLDWCSVGFWAPKNSRPLRTWVMGQALQLGEHNPDEMHIVGNKGASIKSWRCVTENPRSFPYTGEDLTTGVWETEEYMPDRCPNWPGEPPFVMTRDFTTGCFHMRSSCCNHALDFCPDCTNGCIDLWLKKGTRQEGQMQGMCGNANGNWLDDWKMQNGRNVKVNDIKSFGQIEASNEMNDGPALDIDAGRFMHSECGVPSDFMCSWF